MSQKHTQWQPAEIDLLEELMCDFTRIVIVKKIQSYQRNNNLFIRSYGQIANKLRQLGFKDNLQSDRLNKSQLAKLLGIGLPRVQYWFKKGLKFTPGETPSSATSIDLADFSKWAELNLKLLHSIDRDRLAFATNNEDLADRAAALRPYYCPVINITTGQKYSGIERAAIANYLSASALSIALKQGRKCGGFEWKYEVAV